LVRSVYMTWGERLSGAKAGKSLLVPAHIRTEVEHRENREGTNKATE